MKIIVLGSGMVGGVIAGDLASAFDVTCADRDEAALRRTAGRYNVRTQVCDFSKARDVARAVAGFDLVVGAVPGFLGFEVLKAVIEAGKPVADISFFPEDAFGLDAAAKARGLPAIVDCGVAPGLCNLLAGRYNESMKLERYECLVGGLPAHPQPPFYYKVPFSPVDVIEEYTRPARIMENGRAVTREALSEIEPATFESCGTLEAFLTDGLRSLMETMKHVPFMKEKTLRYPGHAAAMKALRDAGLFRKEKIPVNGATVAPADVTMKLLFDRWRYAPGEEDFTVMRVTLEGQGAAGREKIVYDLFDRYDAATQTMSMARTTGFTCAAMAHLLAKGLYSRPGISPPEFVGADESCFRFVLGYLADRQVMLRKQAG
jgi:saccharopine dehydrogenase-like NADP-dependent oxidoreductase